MLRGLEGNRRSGVALLMCYLGHVKKIKMIIYLIIVWPIVNIKCNYFIRRLQTLFYFFLKFLRFTVFKNKF